jgi:hypothetical protein
MLPFLLKTWFLWWAVVIVLGLRWHHVLVSDSQSKAVNTEPRDDEKEWMAVMRELYTQQQ